MEMLLIEGGRPLSGEIFISGGKNSALPIMIASLLCERVSTLFNVPMLSDTKFLQSLLISLGAECVVDDDGRMTIDASLITNTCAHYEMVRKMRASVLVLAPLLTRMGRAQVSLPGGCAIGARPVDIHLEGLSRLGAVLTVRDGYIHGELPQGHFVGADYTLPLPSVGATENLIMAAVLATGTTRLYKAAKEPEVIDLCEALNQAGAKISGHGTSMIEITGVSSLNGLNYRIRPDRIEAGTCMAIALATNSALTLKNVYWPDVANIAERFMAAGAKMQFLPQSDDLGDVVLSQTTELIATDMETAPHPGFPTDMQAQFMAVMTQALGTSIIHERIFDNRMMHVPELCRMGADIKIKHGVAYVSGKTRLMGAPVMATDLRASASLVIGALAAEGISEIRRVYHLDRGYEALEKKLMAVGAAIKRVAQ